METKYDLRKFQCSLIPRCLWPRTRQLSGISPITNKAASLNYDVVMEVAADWLICGRSSVGGQNGIGATVQGNAALSILNNHPVLTVWKSAQCVFPSSSYTQKNHEHFVLPEQIKENIQMTSRTGRGSSLRIFSPQGQSLGL